MKRIGIFLIFVLLCQLCDSQDNYPVLRFQKDGQIIQVSLQHTTDSTYIIKLAKNDSVFSTWKLDYPTYQFDWGDLTGNGMPDIAVGVIKPTRFDPKPTKRLFLFKITDRGYVRPLWLGSRVSQPLVDFRIIKGKENAKVRTIEKEKSGNYLVVEYKWKGFGLQFLEYIKREITLKKAQSILKTN